MIQITLPVIIISLQKHCDPGVHQHPGHNRHAQADCLSKSDLLKSYTALHGWSSPLLCQTPLEYQLIADIPCCVIKIVDSSRHWKLRHKHVTVVPQSKRNC